MLPALLYEMLPLTYISAGALMISAGQELLVLLSAFLFYCAGSIIWVMRSENRRTDHRIAPAHKQLFLPEWMYELKPFVYMFLGVVLIRFQFHTVWVGRCSIYVLVNVFTPPNSHDFASLCFCSHTRNHAK